MKIYKRWFVDTTQQCVQSYDWVNERDGFGSEKEALSFLLKKHLNPEITRLAKLKTRSLKRMRKLK